MLVFHRDFLATRGRRQGTRNCIAARDLYKTVHFFLKSRRGRRRPRRSERMPVVLRNGKICCAHKVLHSMRRHRGTTSPATQVPSSKGGVSADSMLTINASPSTNEAQSAEFHPAVSRTTGDKLVEVRQENGVTAPPSKDSVCRPDVGDDIPFDYKAGKPAVHTGRRSLSSSQRSINFQLLKKGLTIVVALLLVLFQVELWVLLGRFFFWGEAVLALLTRELSWYLRDDSWSGGYANRTAQCHRSRRLKGFNGAGPLIPLVNQLAHSSSIIVVESAQHLHVDTVSDDWDELTELEMDCALLGLPHRTAGSAHDNIASATVHHGNVVVRIPRIMSLSRLSVPAYLREVCTVPHPTTDSVISWMLRGGTSRACSFDELLVFSLLVEKHLQRQAFLEYTETKARAKTSRSSITLPLHPYCLIKSNRKNAPFFNSTQWEAVRLVTHLDKEQVDVLVRTLRAVIQRASSAVLEKRHEADDGSSIALALQTIGSDCDEGLLNLDIKDAISVVYSRTVPHGAQREMVAHPAGEFDADQDKDILGRRTRLSRGADNDGFKGGDENFLRESVTSEPVRLLFTIREAEENLPEWLLKTKVVPRAGPLCFHKIAADPETPHGACTLLRRGPGAKNLLSDKARIIRGASRMGIGALGHHLEEAQLVCDYKTLFASSVFGYGAFCLNKNEPIGGFRKEQYFCVRAMLTQEPPDTAEADAADNMVRLYVGAEIKAANFFIGTCSRQLQNVTRATSLVRAAQQPRRHSSERYRVSYATESGDTSEEGILLILGEESEAEAAQRSLVVNEMMLDAMQAEEALLRHCVAYFADVRRRASVWL